MGLLLLQWTLEVRVWGQKWQMWTQKWNLCHMKRKFAFLQMRLWAPHARLWIMQWGTEPSEEGSEPSKQGFGLTRWCWSHRLSFGPLNGSLSTQHESLCGNGRPWNEAFNPEIELVKRQDCSECRIENQQMVKSTDSKQSVIGARGAASASKTVYQKIPWIMEN